MGLEIVPRSIKQANRIVGIWHRHNRPTQGGYFAVGVEVEGRLCGVAIVGRPVARMDDDGYTCEITRNASDGTYNACSKLYGALCRAAKAIGYRRVLTTNLASESGASLRAAGFRPVRDIPGGAAWDRPGRRRIAVDLFGEPQTPMEAKVKWERIL